MIERNMWVYPLLNFGAVCLTSILLAYWMFTEYRVRRARRLMPELPYPEFKLLPILGHCVGFVKYSSDCLELLEMLGEFSQYYQDGLVLIFGHTVLLVMYKPELIQDYLLSRDRVDKSHIYSLLDCIADGIFIANKHKWRILRKRLNLTFSLKQIDGYMEAVNHHTGVYVDVLNKAQDDKFTNFLPFIERLYFDIMAETHYGLRIDEQIQKEYCVAEHGSKSLEYLIEQRILKPHLHTDFIFQLTQLSRQITKIWTKPAKYVEWMIGQRLENKKNEVEKSNNNSLVYLDMVIDAMKEMNIPTTIHNIQRNSCDILLAGSDTTSVAAATLLYFLAVHKDIQEKVYEEVSGIFGQESFRTLTKDDLAAMTYTEMVIKEALRWSAPTGVFREAPKDLNQNDDYVIPKNTTVYVVTTSQHKNPLYFERPSEFYPEHFTPQAIASRPKAAFIPFSYGPRDCPGKRFAMTLMKTTIAATVNNFYLETNLPLSEVKRKLVLLIQHVQGYPIKFTPRIGNRKSYSNL